MPGKAQITIRLSKHTIRLLDILVESGKFSNRSAAVRAILASYFEAPHIALMRKGNYSTNHYCKYCERWLPKAIFEDALYCPYCGHRLKTRAKRPYIIEL